MLLNNRNEVYLLLVNIDYSLLNLRLDIANRMDEGRVFSSTQTRIYEALKAVFQIITSGDEQLQVPAYNGRLFDDEYYPDFQLITIPSSYSSFSLNSRAEAM